MTKDRIIKSLYRALYLARETEAKLLAELNANKAGGVPKEYYKTITWKTLRALARWLAPTLGCRNCRKSIRHGAHLECHHLYSRNAYRKLGYEDPRRDLAMLCDHCHDIITADHRKAMAGRSDQRNRRARRAALQKVA